jgi:glutathione peroxidase-family protein
VDGDGAVIARFGPTVVPDDPAVIDAIESALG